MNKHDMRVFCVDIGSTYAQLDLTCPHMSVVDEIVDRARELDK